MRKKVQKLKKEMKTNKNASANSNLHEWRERYISECVQMKHSPLIASVNMFKVKLTGELIELHGLNCY